MIQSHYICEDVDLALFGVLPEFLSSLEKKEVQILKQDAYNIKYTYYDSSSRRILKNGGYCRKNTRFDFDKTIPPKVIIEYRARKKSATKRYISEELMSLEELSKILNFDSHMVRTVKFHGKHLSLSMRYGKGDEWQPHLEFIMQSGTVERRKDGIIRPVTFFSLIDTTANEFNLNIANHLAYKTERIFAMFDNLMKEFSLKPISSNRYAELVALAVPQEEKEENLGEDNDKNL